MSPPRSGRWGIHQQVLMLSLLPLMLIVTVLTAYMIDARLEDAQLALQEKGQTQARYLAATAELALYAQDTQTLSRLARKAVEDPEIDDVWFLNAAGEALARGNPNLTLQASPPGYASSGVSATLASGNQWLVQARIRTTSLPVDDYETLEPRHQRIGDSPEGIGAVLVIMSNQQNRQRQDEILRNSLFIAATGLLITLALALHLGSRITRPILRLKSRMEALHKGAAPLSDERETSAPLDEISSLEQGFDRLGRWVTQTNEQLEARVTRATSDLSQTLAQLERRNRELDKARHQAEQANRAKDQFVARMSHELRTPLTSILGFLDLLKQTQLNTEQREYGEIIQSTSRLLLSLIDDILDYAKLQADGIHLEEIDFDLLACIEDVVEMEAPFAQEKGLDLVLNYDPRLPDRLVGDPTRISQILTNLLSNAIKFTERGRVNVALTAGQQEKGSLKVVLKVSDTGIGIPKHQLEHLFAPFTQADTTITRRFGGSGLGLAISNKLATLMNGRVTIASELNRGTELAVQLELGHTAKPVARIGNNRMRTLVFDSSNQAMQALKSMMSRWSQHVSATSSRQQLLEKLKTEPDSLDVLVIGLRNGAVNEVLSQELLSQVRPLFPGPIYLMIRGPERDNPIPGELAARLQPLEPLYTPHARKKLLQKLDAYLTNEPDQPPEEGLQADQHVDLSQRHILIAEDNAFNRLLLEKLLSRLGAQFTSVRNGLEAFLACQRHQFDLILMDVHMPLMDGGEAAARIRRINDHYLNISMIALTADVVASERETLKQANVTQILYKPIDEYRLRACLCAATQISERTDTLPSLQALGISAQDFHQELLSQLEALNEAFLQGNRLALRDQSHQLLGLAGLLELPEMEAAAQQFNSSVKRAGTQRVWKDLWRLQRILKSYLS